MPEHLTRLRGPWELFVEPIAGTEAIRIELPADRLPGSDRPLRLRRRFGRPVRFRPGTPCLLRSEDVPGLFQMRLNGEPLEVVPAVESRRSGSFEVPIGARLLPRNVLELTVAPGPPRPGNEGRPWGSIALVFEDGDDPPG